MDLFKYSGPEVDIGMSCCVKEMTITKFEIQEEGNKITAEGTITAKDYIEHGIEFTDPWVATGIRVENSYIWVVTRKDDEDKFWIDRNTGEICFTLNETINKGLKQFIGDWLLEYLGGKLKDVVIKEYDGPIHKYTGVCICDQLKASTKNNSFDWLSMTNNGDHPENCFECSCGNKWFRLCPPEEAWVLVGDPDAWEMLLKFNGIEVEKIAIFKGELHLLQSIRDMGLIPIG